MMWASASWEMRGQKNMKGQEEGLPSQSFSGHVSFARPFTADRDTVAMAHPGPWAGSCLSLASNQLP